MVNEKESLKCKVLTLLRESPGIVSGVELSKETGRSRVAVWKAVQGLQEAGYTIEVSRKGYRLAKDLADSIYPWEFGSDEAMFTHFASTTSTMAEAKRIAESSKAQPGETHIITADMQTHGVGQHGKSWTTTRGSLAFTVVTKNYLPLACHSRMTMAAQVALTKVLRRITGRQFYIRWPNDIWSDDGKVVGILEELSSCGNICTWINLGIGINITRKPHLKGTDSIFHREAPITRKEILSQFWDEFKIHEKMAAEQSPWLADEWNRLCLDTGHRMRLAESGKTVIFRGVNSFGSAIISAPGSKGERLMLPGTGSFIKSYI
ncbi:MAG: biotin--[acetyl-CoA-carboxylase] ligase [Spirochaetia bacterium]|nr:biotin--[acetyl-CoA-carboxylase] ligase [Spirochaetia bacterium]